MVVWKIIVILHRRPYRRSPVWVKRVGCSQGQRFGYDIYKSVYSTLFLGSLKPGKFQISVKDETAVDDLCGYVNICRPLTRERRESVFVHIPREASALSVLLRWAFQGLNERERATVRLSRFSFLTPTSADAVSPEAFTNGRLEPPRF